MRGSQSPHRAELVAVRVIMGAPLRRINYLRVKGRDHLRQASIANCKTTIVAPVAATARSPCPIRVMRSMLRMCAYSVS
jgi:hypothetical protein